MLTVIKRSGREELFNMEKIKNSTAAASDELQKPLASSDINHLAEAVRKQLEGKEQVFSRDIFGILVSVMRQQGFLELADAYAEYASNFMHKV